jgi:oligopeptide transport system substrate-binding protein
VVYELDPSRRLEMYQRGSLDTISLWGFPHTNLTRVARRYAEEYFTHPLPWTGLLIFNPELEPVNDPRVRRALAYALDREAVASVSLGGTESPAQGGLLPPGMPGYASDTALPYDRHKAKQLLQEAGYTNSEALPEVIITYLQTSGVVLEKVASQWNNNLGLRCTLEPVIWSELLRRVYEDKPPHVVFLYFAPDYPDPDSFLRVGNIIGGLTSWCVPAYSQLVGQARRTMDRDERIQLYRQAERILLEEAPVIPVVYGRQHMLIKPWVQKLSSSVIRENYWKDVVIDPH